MSVPVSEKTASVTYPLPPFLEGKVVPSVYVRWLKNRADAHFKRDSLRGHTTAGRLEYRRLIHEAVLASSGRDVYTGEELDWRLIGTYRNEDSLKGRHAYKRSFGLLPTIDHHDAAATVADFRICAWRTNDAKHDLTTLEFIELSKRVLEHHGFTVTGPA